MDGNYLTIKHSLKKRAMRLWGVENQDFLDPLIEMLLDVFAYEFSKVHSEIELSDAKLLERISKILVHEKWALPQPAHALLRAVPMDDTYAIEGTTQFFTQKVNFIADNTDLFFTPLIPSKLVKARIHCVSYENQLQLLDSRADPYISLPTKKDRKLPDYQMWFGISIDKDLLEETNLLDIAVLLGDSSLSAYLPLLEITTYGNERIPIKQTLKRAGENTDNHYFDTIHRYYQNHLYTLDISAIKKEKSNSQLVLGDYFDMSIIDEHVSEDLLWFKITFPVPFVSQELNEVSLAMNTFPIVNRQKAERQHNLARNGRIIPLASATGAYFLNVDTLIDNNNHTFTSGASKDIHNMDGTYSLYFGDIEQFDERNAKTMLEQVIQKVRQEGSAFSVFGYDLLNSYLSDLNHKLEAIETKITTKYKGDLDDSQRQFLVTVPYQESSMMECSYWTTNADLANGLPKGATMAQYQTGGLETNTISLKTTVKGGSIKRSTEEKVSNLRYGLLSRDRIVSSHDIREFIKKSIGKTVENVSIASGVAVSTKKNQGLIRTADIKVTLTKQGAMNIEDKRRLANYLEVEITNKSVQNIPYRVEVK